MKKLGNRSSNAISLVLIAAIIASLMTCLPVANAANIPTYAFLAVIPNPIGVNQEATVAFWLNEFPPTASGAQGDRWQGYKLEITKPDGTNETLGPYESDPVGSKLVKYTPDKIGTYYFKFSFPGQHIKGARYGQPIDNEYLPSESHVVELTVQQEPIPDWPSAALPKDYWTRPIDASNRNWWQISGNWLAAGYNHNRVFSAQGFNPYTTAPSSAHIMWTKEMDFGGLVGGEYGGNVAYYTGLSYEGKWRPPVIMQGRLYYNVPLSNSPTGSQQFACVDIRTGETLWTKNGTITCGQIYDYESPNQHGALPYLWQLGSQYKMYDAFTGDLILTIANASTGTITFSPTGDLLVYILNGMQNTLLMWNSSKAIPLPATTGPDAWSWRPTIGATLDWRRGIQWNTTVPDVPGMQSIMRIDKDVIWAGSFLMNTDPPVSVDVAYDLKDQGRQMWVANRTVMIDPGLYAGGIGPMGEGVYALFSKEKMQWYGYDVNTGAKLWGPTTRYENDWGMYVAVLGGEPLIAYGKMFAQGFDGRIHCFDIKNGTELWTYYTGSSGFETPYGQWPFYGGPTVADGKVYSTNGEHSPGNPLWRGERLHCVDAKTGKGIWNISGWFQGPVVADGYLLSLNGADNRIYCFGKGQTTTSVSASPKVSVHGNSVLIEGTVIDQSPGAKGTPAIADASMGQWMEYLYMQQPIPTNATGVEVTLDTIDPNGNFVHIGTVTSDAGGMFKKMFTPEVPGEYTIIATFEGSESYYASYAETAIGVSEAPPATAPPEYPQPVDNTMTIIGVGIAMIIAVFLAAVWIKRK